MYNSIELFSGAGGLALGLAQAGFHHELLIEWNQHACRTLRYNQQANFYPVNTWNVVETDAQNFDFSTVQNPIDLVAGGPPCQPFSLGGKHKSHEDSRDMFPVAVRAVRELNPKAFVFENVKGLLRASFNDYLQYVVLQLSYPQLVKKESESREQHLYRLENIQASDKSPADGYRTVVRLLNAADYGVPQKRERIFIVGFRNDCDAAWQPPQPTHSEDALIWAKWVTGDYWEEHGIAAPNRPAMAANDRKAVDKVYQKYGMFGPTTSRWRTVRDAIAHLPTNTQNHETRAGAQIYPGHTGSELDEPAKTLKAGDHGVPGGENMVRFYDNSVRYFSVRESARIQTFPDDFFICGSWTEGMRQIGNAVPVQLAHCVGQSIKNQLESLPIQPQRSERILA